MVNLRKILILIVGVLLSSAAWAQEVSPLRVEKRYTFYFRVNSDKIDEEYMGNSETIARMQEELAMVLESPDMIDSLILKSTSSPEGSVERNRALAQQRSKSARALVEGLFPGIDRSRMKIGFQEDEDWDGLEVLVERDTLLDGRDRILKILRASSTVEERKEKLRRLDRGKIYNNLIKKYYNDLRYCNVQVRVVLKTPESSNLVKEVTFVAPSQPLKVVWPKAAPEVPSFHRHLTLKTNTLGWVLGEQNIAIEVDLAKHLSLSVPFYYSGGFDYFKETIKFRGIVLQPELRYFPKLAEDMTNNGFFVGAHFGLGWYNFAVNTDYRVQDHGGNRPAFGGGLGVGYAMKFKKNPRWGMEFVLGAGVYDVLYDTFYNENNGPYNEKAVHDVWFGIDNAAVSFTYNFDLKKGGKK